jgi:hypothetical protein
MTVPIVLIGLLFVLFISLAIWDALNLQYARSFWDYVSGLLGIAIAMPLVWVLYWVFVYKMDGPPEIGLILAFVPGVGYFPGIAIGRAIRKRRPAPYG